MANGKTHEIYALGVGVWNRAEGMQYAHRHNTFGDISWHTHPAGDRSNINDRGLGFMARDGWVFVNSGRMTQGFKSPVPGPGHYVTDQLIGKTIKTDNYSNGVWISGTQVLEGSNWYQSTVPSKW